ncbi:MAG: 1,4-alpha-glucan branching protein, partial [Verrucomicrobiales bacterium]|nr:1,4-alpha-glucan branching protein [Verrucomicrobiales bacterium]
MTNDSYPSLGAVLKKDEGATEFSVWAPHADAVFVAGNFNDWKTEDVELDRGDDDRWRGKVEKVQPGTEYKFVIKNGDQVLWKNDPSARAMTNSAGNSVVVDDSAFDWGNDAEFQLPPWNELVIYEMHIGTFHRNGNGDQVGTFDDALERLDHIKSLGVNCIEIMPVAEFAGGQSWGYNPAFPFAIESDYGGVDGLKKFVKTCHENGIAVLIDVVYNHFGPSDLDLWQFDGWSENGKGGIYFYNDWRAETPWGDTRPDYGRQEVRQYIRDNALMWLDAFHADGLRFDMTFYMRSVNDGADIPEGWSLAQWINHDINEQFPGTLTIAEDLRSNEWITKTTGEGGAGFGSQWDE